MSRDRAISIELWLRKAQEMQQWEAYLPDLSTTAIDVSKGRYLLRRAIILLSLRHIEAGDLFRPDMAVVDIHLDNLVIEWSKYISMRSWIHPNREWQTILALGSTICTTNGPIQEIACWIRLAHNSVSRDALLEMAVITLNVIIRRDQSSQAPQPTSELSRLNRRWIQRGRDKSSSSDSRSKRIQAHWWRVL